MEHVRLKMEERIAEVRLERGKVNALDDRLVAELARCLEQLAEDPEVGAVVLTGTGKFFSFGFDIPRFLSYAKEQFIEFLGRFTTLYRELFAFPKPVVAALNGHTVAGGCMLAIACDARIMAAGKGKIGLNEIGFGSSVFAGSAAILAYLLGARRAQEVLYGGELYAAEDARAMGLVDAVTPSAETAVADAAALARRLAAKDGRAFAALKLLQRRQVLDEIQAREEASIHAFAELWYSERTWSNLRAIRIHD